MIDACMHDASISTFFFLVYSSIVMLVLQYSINGAVIMSPSPRAYVCNAGDRLELTCNTTESALLWRLTLMGMSDVRDIAISSTSVGTRRGIINNSQFTATRISGTGETPLISISEISPVTDGLNGTFNITCMSLGSLTSGSMATTTVYFAGLPIHLNPPLIVIEEEFGMDDVVVGLHWVQQNYKNLFATYNISILPTINANVTTSIRMISNTRANLTVPYNTPYNVSIVADLCGSQATTQVKIHYAACAEPALSLVSGNNPQDHGNISVLMVSGLGYGRPSLEGESARLFCPPELVQVGPNLTTCTGNGRWEPDPMKVSCKANCNAPLIPNVARIFPYSNTLEGTIVAYTCHGDTNNILAAVCSNRGIWEPNLSHICGPGVIELSRDGKVAIASSVSVFIVTSILFFIAGFLCRHFCQTTDRSNNNEPEIRADCACESENRPLGPLYDNVLLNQHNSETVELKENIAYGPINLIIN